MLVALAFDWVVDSLYYILKADSTSSSPLSLFNVSIFDRDSSIPFGDLGEMVDAGDTFQMIMNPFSGYARSIVTRKWHKIKAKIF